MQRKTFLSMECSIARSLEELGDGWSLLILRSALLGASRFQQFQEMLDIPPTTLARRLEALCAQGLFKLRRYEERPPRDEYRLTQKGNDVLPILLAIGVWGNRWHAPRGPLFEFVDPQTGAALEPVLCDRISGRELRPGAVALKAGPGASEQLRASIRQPVVFGAREVAA